MITPPPIMVNEIMTWANIRLADKEWKQTSKKFKADIAGWKYLERFEKADEECRKRANDWLGEITVTLIRVKDITKLKTLGTFSNHTAHMKVKICDGVLFEVIVLHELIHWSQGYLELLAGYKPNKKKRMEFFFNVGYPSTKIRDYYIVPQWKNKKRYSKVWEKKGIKTDEELHFLNDIEFYPNLYLLKLRFSYICFTLRLKKKKEIIEAFKVFMAIKDYKDLDTKLQHKFRNNLTCENQVCAVLKKFSPEKWKKYVKEMWKECVNNEFK